MTLGEQIEQQTGIKLPIGDGKGSLADPVQITTSDPAEAMHAICSALDVIHSLSAKAWCLRGWPESEDDLPGLLATQVETNWIDGNEVIRDRRSYFFKTPNEDAARHIANDVQMPTVAIGQTGVQLPFNIAWLNLRNVSEPDAENPGAGWVATYVSPGIQSDITIYNEAKPVPEGADGEARLIKAFYRAVGEVTLNEQCGEPQRSGSLVSDNNQVVWMFADFQTGNHHNVWIALTRIGEWLLKFKMRLQADEEAVYGNADETLQFVFRMIAREPLRPAPLPK